MIRAIGWPSVCGGLLLGLATPPAAMPLGEWLVLPALAFWYVVAAHGRRPLLGGYLFGCVHMAWFSWSVRHVMLPAYIAIVVLGGLYYLLGSAAVRAVRPRWRSWTFAVAVGGAFWLRAQMPEIHYPHGQPVHCLWQWPLLDGAVVLGGEPLANVLLALAAAWLAEACRSWRCCGAVRRRAIAWCLLGFGSWFVFGALASLAVPRVAASAADSAGQRALQVVAIEPGYHPDELWHDGAYQRILAERLFAPTLAVLEASAPPDLVVWPESALPFDTLVYEDAVSQRVRLRLGPLTARGAPRGRLLLGAQVAPRGGRAGLSTAAAVLVELPSGRVLDLQQKQRLVPGGEFLPLLDVLPDAWADALRAAFRSALGVSPDGEPGASRPPFEVAGLRVGALLCFDNAFSGPAIERAAAGADLLVVLSNEAWYRGGAELDQMLAMTSMRALEVGRPILRCTTDGRSVLFDARGEQIAGLAQATAPQPRARKLAVSVVCDAEGQAPIAATIAVVGPLCGAFVGLVLLHGLWRWARLRASRTPSPTGGATGVARGGPGGS